MESTYLLEFHVHISNDGPLANDDLNLSQCALKCHLIIGSFNEFWLTFSTIQIIYLMCTIQSVYNDLK